MVSIIIEIVADIKFCTADREQCDHTERERESGGGRGRGYPNIPRDHYTLP